MLFAQRHEPAAAELHDLFRRRSAGAPLPEAEIADEHEALRVRELTAIAELVLDHPAPQGHGADDRGVPGSMQHTRVPRGVEPARAAGLGPPVPTPAGATRVGGLQGRPGRGVPRDGAHPKLGAATVGMKRPDPPAHDRFGQRVALGPDAGLEERLAHGEGAAGSAGTGSAGTGSAGTGSAGTGSAAGAGSAWGTGSASGSGRT